MTTTNLLIKFNHHSHIKQPDYLKYNNAFVIQSPINIKLKPRCDALLDLGFNLKFESNNHTLWLKPSTIFGSIGLDIQNKDNWHKNLTKNNTIMLHSQNTSFYYDIKIKPNDVIGYVFILGKTSNENVIAEYNVI